MVTVETLSSRLSLIDGLDMGMANRTGTYVLHEEEITLIESGPSPSVPNVLKGLQKLHIAFSDIKYVVVTHIHLDHAGGAGLLLSYLPNARLVVHPRGAKHLINPARLIEGSKAVYGSEQFPQLFDPVVPVSKERIIIKEDMDTLCIGLDSTLTFYHTPGHAAHHFSIYDKKSKGIFTGDTLGVYYSELEKENCHFVLPSTSPSQFNPRDLLKSIERIERLDIDFIYFGHFQASNKPDFVFQQLRQWLPRFLLAGRAIYKEDKAVEKLQDHLLVLVQKELDRQGISRNHNVYKQIHLDLYLCSLGIIDFLQKGQ
ncbi:beta-lactamase related protein [Halalkalibacter wakoensis JCM 9140]|uniref:Beta-lactamase related protein n=1 Tax=Halalkalibacter wakoensis JCM 9140 TaxID=1236970 RepID=W4PYV8_9BACI|nr:MBL fold metallo-hydrolase [Halalkalibacter wakoensis]GAE25006.1 beta-lactamase related protein [Halalkalibacter wakoensis JCM 9140]